MTIEEVMHKAVVYAREVRDGNDENCWESDELRAAITALVAQARDEALEEAAKVCEGVPAFIGARSGARIEPTKHDCAKAIRMSIAARKGE